MNSIFVPTYSPDRGWIEDLHSKANLKENQASKSLSDIDSQWMIKRIKALLVEKNAVLVAHYYTDDIIQQLAEETGGKVSDSLEMARFGFRSEATTLVVAGVRFMGETAKILNPEKKVIMPDLDAQCSLDLACPVDEFSKFCDAYPDRTVVVYANTSAEVKARADWVVTSGIALKVVQHLVDKGEKIIWAPDKHLGRYVQDQTGGDIVLWPGYCVVHERFKSSALTELKKHYPRAAVLVHPESPKDMIDAADVVGSTTALINAARDLDNDSLIVATERGIFYKMQQVAPNKKLIEAPTAGEGASCESCAHCSWMGLNNLQSLLEALEHESNQITLPTQVMNKASVSIKRMLDFVG